MLTPAELRNKTFKNGHGYDKREVEQFMNELAADYEHLLKENEDLKKNVQELGDSVRYYKSIEKTLQKALILAEKTSQDIKATAIKEAEVIEMEAKAKAEKIWAISKSNIELLEHKTLNLIHQYNFFKIQFENLLNSQLQLINSDSYKINTSDFTYREEPITDATEEPRQPEEASQEPEQKPFDFLMESSEPSTKTEDGFEFINLLDHI